MGLKSLTESILLEALNDLYEGNHRNESIRFFSSPDFYVAAELAGMGLDEQMKILDIVRKIVIHTKKREEKTFRLSMAGRAKTSPHALPAPSQFL